MSDLIERDKAIEAIRSHIKDIDGDNDALDYIATNMIKDVPSANRPQGKWKAKSFHEFFCNNCGFSFDIMKCEFLENMKHCPNCGAKMEGADDEEVDVLRTM